MLDDCVKLWSAAPSETRQTTAELIYVAPSAELAALMFFGVVVRSGPLGGYTIKKGDIPARPPNCRGGPQNERRLGLSALARVFCCSLTM